MKTIFQTKFLHHLVQSRPDQGFTLIELLVVIVIIGILAAIALPSFLSQANKARQSEAKTYIGSVNRGQQAYFIEYGQFGNSFAVLEVGIDNSTPNYDYSITFPGGDAATNAKAQKASLKSYGGRIRIANNAFTSLMCESAQPLQMVPTWDTNAGSPLLCPLGFQEVSR